MTRSIRLLSMSLLLVVAACARANLDGAGTRLYVELERLSHIQRAIK